MEEVRIREGGIARLGRVQGDLKAGDHVLIQASEGAGVVVAGTASFEGGVEVDCDFECDSLHAEDGLLRVNGNLTVHEDIDVEDALYTRGNVRATDIDVGGKLSVGISLDADCVDIGGSLEVQGNIGAKTVDVGGSFEVQGETKLTDLDVGGRAEIGGGEVTGTIDVGGSFRSRKVLKFNQIDAGGTIELAGGVGKEIDVGGKLESKGDLTCDRVDVGGLVDVQGNLLTKETQVGGKIGVSGDLGPVDSLEVGGVVEIGGVLSGIDVEVGGSLKASKALLSGKARIGGLVSTTNGLKAQTIELGRGSRCRGILVGGRVVIERRGHVEDVYCSVLEADDGTTLGRVYAENVELGDGCVVEKVLYTGALKVGDRVTHRSPPEKTERLPPFPL
jgi:predicted acyltransferase (DUF342 family)